MGNCGTDAAGLLATAIRRAPTVAVTCSESAPLERTLGLRRPEK